MPSHGFNTNNRIAYLNNSDCNTLTQEWVIGKGTNYPTNAFWYVHSFAYSVDANQQISVGKQIAYSYDNTSDCYVRIKNTAEGNWTAWEKAPTRSEIDAHTAKITTINNTNSPYTKTFSADEYCVIFVTLNNDFNVYYAFSTTGSNCVLMKIHENISSISASVSDNTLSITNTASSNARLVIKRL